MSDGEAIETMTSTMQKPASSHGPAFKSAPAKRRSGIKGADEKGIWLSLLDNVSRGKDLAEKQLVVLGKPQYPVPSCVLNASNDS